MPAVIATPRVDNKDAGFQASFIADKEVCRPPSNKITASANVPNA